MTIDWLAAHLGLFANALAAATILPLSSEALLAALVAHGAYDVGGLWLWASVGNVLGAVVNFGLGRAVLRFRDRRWFPVGPRALERAQGWFSRWGVWSLLLAWVPVIGDPLTVAAGALRVRFWPFLLLVGSGKAGRYAVVVWGAGLMGGGIGT